MGGRLAYRLTLVCLAATLPACGLAVAADIWMPMEALTAFGVLAAALAGVYFFGAGRPAPQAWSLCAATLFALLLGGVYHLLPDYNRKFSLRGQVRRHRELSSAPALPVVCFPKRWDSVSFYLGRGDVEVYGHGQLAGLVAGLAEYRPETLLFVKAGEPLRRVVEALPAGLEFVPQGRQRNDIAVGLVRPRQAEDALAPVTPGRGTCRVLPVRRHPDLQRPLSPGVAACRPSAACAPRHADHRRGRRLDRRHRPLAAARFPQVETVALETNGGFCRGQRGPAAPAAKWSSC